MTSPRSTPRSARRVHACRATATVLAASPAGRRTVTSGSIGGPSTRSTARSATSAARRAPTRRGSSASAAGRASGASSGSSPLEVVGVDERVAGGVVERPALLVELGEPARLDRERPVAGIGLDTAPRRLRRDVQEHGEAPVAEPPAGDRRQDRALPRARAPRSTLGAAGRPRAPRASGTPARRPPRRSRRSSGRPPARSRGRRRGTSTPAGRPAPRPRSTCPRP